MATRVPLTIVGARAAIEAGERVNVDYLSGQFAGQSGRVRSLTVFDELVGSVAVAFWLSKTTLTDLIGEA